MKEKFFYLEQKYNIKLIINNLFDKKGNLYSYIKQESIYQIHIFVVQIIILSIILLSMIIRIISHIEHVLI